MAKKILSILCALAMMVTMVSVAAFSASAAPEGYADFDGLADMTVTTDTAWYGQTWWPSVASGRYTSTYFGSDVLFTTQARIVAASAENYNIDDEFSVKYYINRAKAGNSTNGTQYGYMNEFKLGDLYILFTSTNRIVIDCSVKYGDTVIATSEGTWTNYTAITVGSEEHEAIRTDFSTAYPSGASSWGESEERSKLEVNISFADGKLTVAYGGIDTPSRQVTVEADIANADFSDAKMEVSVGERKNDGVALYGFTGTYKTVTTGGGEGGETPDPDEPGDTPDLAPGTMGNITSENWVKDDFGVTTGSHGQSGYYDTPTAGDSIWAMASSTNIKLTSTIGTYNVSDAYTLAFDLFYKSGTNGQTRYEVTIGDLVLTFVSDASHNLAGSATYDGTAVTFNNDLYLDWNCYSSVTPQTMADELAAAISDAELSENWIASNKSYNPNKKTNVQITLADGTLTVVSKNKTCTANLTAAGYDKTADLGETEVKLAVEINKESAGIVVGGIGNFSGSYTAASASETPDPLAPTGVYPTLNSDLTLNVIYANAADYKDTVEVTATVDGDSQTVSLTEKGGNLVASFDFLTPDQFGSEITLNAVDTNGIAESYSTTYSVKQYCKNMMDKDSSSAELKALCMALLQFGGKAQALDGSDTITADMSSYIDAYAPTAWTKGTAAWTYTGDQAIKFSGSNLNFADEIGINVYFTADGDASDYKVVSTFGTVSDVVDNGSNFKATIRISSSMLSQQTAITVKDVASNEVVSETFTLSVEDYANGGSFTAAEMECVVALMTYGDAAVAYGATLN